MKLFVFCGVKLSELHRNPQPQRIQVPPALKPSRSSASFASKVSTIPASRALGPEPRAADARPTWPTWPTGRASVKRSGRVCRSATPICCCVRELVSWPFTFTWGDHPLTWEFKMIKPRSPVLRTGKQYQWGNNEALKPIQPAALPLGCWASTPAHHRHALPAHLPRSQAKPAMGGASD